MAKKSDDYQEEEETTSLAVNDAWTGMLVISFLALSIGTGFLAWDWSQYSDKDPPTPPKYTSTPPGAIKKEEPKKEVVEDKKKDDDKKMDEEKKKEPENKDDEKKKDDGKKKEDEKKKDDEKKDSRLDRLTPWWSASWDQGRYDRILPQLPLPGMLSRRESMACLRDPKFYS